MPNRRTPPGLKLAAHLRIAPDVIEAKLAGLGLDWSTIPGVLDEVGRAEWCRLQEVFALEATRFREGDRAAVTAYCTFWAVFCQAATELAEHGPLVPGRSSRDGERLVKNPASVQMREAATQLRYWARELGLTPDARGRMGLTESASADHPANPFDATWKETP